MPQATQCFHFLGNPFVRNRAHKHVPTQGKAIPLASKFPDTCRRHILRNFHGGGRVALLKHHFSWCDNSFQTHVNLYR